MHMFEKFPQRKLSNKPDCKHCVFTGSSAVWGARPGHRAVCGPMERLPVLPTARSGFISSSAPYTPRYLGQVTGFWRTSVGYKHRPCYLLQETEGTNESTWTHHMFGTQETLCTFLIIFRQPSCSLCTLLAFKNRHKKFQSLWSGGEINLPSLFSRGEFLLKLKLQPLSVQPFFKTFKYTQAYVSA